MYPFEPNLHSLMSDAGGDIREVVDNYPALIQSETPGYYYRLASLDIRRCCDASDRWRTLSQWEPVPGQFVDGLGTN